MAAGLWTCQYKGCSSSPEQVAALRSRRPDGFPHDEDPSLRVCTVCRRLPLKEQSASGKEDQLDSAFLSGIKEELASIEENEKNIQALSQVFRYYAKYAKQLSQVLYEFAVKNCFPWEIIHAMHLVDDILLMDNSGRYKVELSERVKGIAIRAFSKVQTEQEQREVARMLHTWQELKIFDTTVVEAIRAEIRSSVPAAKASILDEVYAAEEDCDLEPEEPAKSASSTAGAKRKREEPTSTSTGATNGTRVEAVSKPAPMPAAASIPAQAAQVKVLAMVQRVLSAPATRPFEVLGISEAGAEGHDIRKAYRRIALLIHPDKNPGMEAKCQEALIKLQQSREQAESNLQRLEGVGDGPQRGETRSEATAAAANASADAVFTCKYPGCDLPPCKQCANGCCTRNITHCHMVARSKGGLQCFFHPPPRAWARNA